MHHNKLVRSGNRNPDSRVLKYRDIIKFSTLVEISSYLTQIYFSRREGSKFFWIINFEILSGQKLLPIGQTFGGVSGAPYYMGVSRARPCLMFIFDPKLVKRGSNESTRSPE